MYGHKFSGVFSFRPNSYIKADYYGNHDGDGILSIYVSLFRKLLRARVVEIGNGYYTILFLGCLAVISGRRREFSWFFLILFLEHRVFSRLTHIVYKCKNYQ